MIFHHFPVNVVSFPSLNRFCAKQPKENGKVIGMYTVCADSERLPPGAANTIIMETPPRVNPTNCYKYID